MVTLTPDTPTVPLRLEPGVDFHPAPLPTRILAYLLDLAASVIITFALYRFGGLLLLRLMGGDTFIAQTFSQSMLFIGGLGYWVVLPLTTGATPAKMLFHLRIVPDVGKPLGPTQVILREVIGHVATVTSLGVGFLIAARDPHLRGLNDLLAGTRIIQLTPPRPELYRIHDLRTVDMEGTLVSDDARVVEEVRVQKVGEGLERSVEEVIPAEEIVEIAGQEVTISEEEVAEIAGQEAAISEVEPAIEMAAEIAGQEAAVSEVEPAIEKTAEIAQPPVSSLYVRPAGETAQERKMRAARGPTIEELATALRRTAVLVEEGQLMPKVMDRKREDFVDQIKTTDLGDSSVEAVKIIVALGKEGLLTREELEQVYDILRNRLGK